jgi:lipid-binding SYLF domain-containing protein
MTATARIVGMVVLGCGALAGQRAAVGQNLVTKETGIVLSARDVMMDLTQIPARGIPLGLLEQSQGIAIFPDMIKAGFVVGGRHGNGVVMLKHEDGSWSNPIFLMMTGGSIGWQVGAQASDVVLLFKSRRSVEDFLQQRKITLGVDAAIAAGPIGRQAEASTDLKFKAEILSYSRSRGLFAGAAIQGAGIRPNENMNSHYYGGLPISLFEILDGFTRDGAMIQPPPSAQSLQMTIARLTGSPIRKDPTTPTEGATETPATPPPVLVEPPPAEEAPQLEPAPAPTPPPTEDRSVRRTSRAVNRRPPTVRFTEPR